MTRRLAAIGLLVAACSPGEGLSGTAGLIYALNAGDVRSIFLPLNE